MDWPLTSSELVFSNEVSHILHKLGLELEDLEILVSYPEDQTTPEKLPFIVNQIRLQKTQRSSETVQSQTDPEPSTSINEMEKVNQTKEEEELHQDVNIPKVDQVMDHGNTRKDTGILEEEISETGGSGDKSYDSTSLLTDFWLNQDRSEITNNDTGSTCEPDPSNCELNNQSLNQPIQMAQVLLEDWNSALTSPSAEILPMPPLKGSEPEIPPEPQPSTNVIKVSQLGRRGIMLYDSLKKQPNTSLTEHVKEQQQKLRLNPSHPGERALDQNSMSLCNPILTDSMQTVLYSTYVTLPTTSSELVSYPIPENYAKLDHGQHPAKRKASKGLQLLPVSHQQAVISTPGLFPHTCPLCFEECTDMAEWISHQKTNLHLNNYKDAVGEETRYSSVTSPKHQRRKTRRRSHSGSRSKSQRERQSSGSQSRSYPCRRTPEVRRTKRNSRSRSPAGYCRKRNTRQSRSPSSSLRTCRKPAKSPQRSHSSKSQRERQSSGSQSHSSPCRRTLEGRRTRRNSRSRSPAGYCRKRSVRLSLSPSLSPRTCRRPAKRADRSSRSSSCSPQHSQRRKRSSQSPRQLPSAYIYRNSSRSRSSTSRDSPCRSRSQSPESPSSPRRRDVWCSFSRRYDRLRSPRRRSEGLDSPKRRDGRQSSPGRSEGLDSHRQASPKIRDGRQSSPRRSEKQSFQRLSPKRMFESHSSPRRIDKRGSSLRSSQEGKSSSEMSCPRRPSMEETLTQKLLQSAVVQSLPKGVDVVEIVKTLTPALLVELDRMNSAEVASPSMSTKLEEDEATSAVKHEATVSANRRHKQLNLKPIGSEQKALKSEESKSKTNVGEKDNSMMFSSTKNASKSRSEEAGTISDESNLKLLPKIPQSRTTDSANKLKQKNTSQIRKLQKSQLSDKDTLEGRREPKYSEKSPESRSEAPQEQPEALKMENTGVSESKDEPNDESAKFKGKIDGFFADSDKNVKDTLTETKLGGGCPARKADVSQPRPPMNPPLNLKPDIRPPSHVEKGDITKPEIVTQRPKSETNPSQVQDKAMTATTNYQSMNLNSEMTGDCKFITDESISDDRNISTDNKASPNRETCTPNTTSATVENAPPDRIQAETKDPLLDNSGMITFKKSVEQETETKTNALLVQEDTNSRIKGKKTFEEVREIRSVDLIMDITDDSENILNDKDLQVQQEATTCTINHQNFSLTMDTKGAETVEPMTLVETTEVKPFVDTKALPNIVSDAPMPSQKTTYPPHAFTEPVVQDAETGTDARQIQDTTRTKSQKDLEEVKEDRSTDQEVVPKKAEGISKDGDLEAQQQLSAFTINHQNASLTVDTKGNKSIEPVTTLEPFVARGEEFINTKVLPNILSDTANPKDHLQDKPSTTIFPKSRNAARKVQEESSSRTNSQKIYLEVKEDGSFCVIKNSESLFEVEQVATTSTVDHQKASLIKTTEPESFCQTEALSNTSDRTMLNVDTALQKPPPGPPQAPLDDPFDMLLELIRSTKESHLRLRSDDVMKEASNQPDEGQSSPIGIEAANHVETSTKSNQSRPPNTRFCYKKDTFKPKTKYLTSPVPEAEAASSSAAIRFPTPGERFVMCLHRSSLQYVNPKTLNWSTDSVTDMKVLLVKELPAYRVGFYSERDVADLFVPFGFQYPEENIHNIYVFPEACMAFVLLPNMKAVQCAMDSASGRGLCLKSCRVSLHVLDIGPASMKPIQFYKFLMKQVGYIVTDGGKSTVYVENISPSEALDLRELFRTNGRVKNFLRLLNKVFIEMQCELDTDVLGVWFSLRRAHTYRFYRLKAPVGQAATLPPKPRVDCVSAAEDLFLEAVVLPRIPSVPSGSFAPFWVTVTTSPFAFATLSPWFNVPDHVTISSELDVLPPQGVGAHCTIMLTGLPQTNYQHEDVVVLLRPYLPETNPSTVFYSVNVLPLQCRAFVHFANMQRCHHLIRDHLRQPLSVQGSELSVHLVLEDMELGFSEDALFVNLMRWSNAGIPRPDALLQRLISVEVSQFSLDVVKAVMKEVASVSPFVNFLPLSNRIIVEMAEPGDVTCVLEESHFPAEVSAALSAESLRRRLQSAAEEPLPSESSETEASPKKTITSTRRLRVVKQNKERAKKHRLVTVQTSQRTLRRTTTTSRHVTRSFLRNLQKQ
ncbi:uncharacterized protein LOC114480108 isoform X2 [Gouania willdenowi]|uniref:uncharacterized protein LOC114480108 isoform X2 n=1 Tax=Gouania willdenowi TaxID=441366 RepID=UPI0010543611|nr:uncharacterized protein LOC114480108 isoform X2 [Gouania willdenowi]